MERVETIGMGEQKEERHKGERPAVARSKAMDIWILLLRSRNIE